MSNELQNESDYDNIYTKLKQIKDKHKKHKDEYSSSGNSFSLKNYNLAKVNSDKKLIDVFVLMNNDILNNEKDKKKKGNSVSSNNKGYSYQRNVSAIFNMCRQMERDNLNRKIERCVRRENELGRAIVNNCDKKEPIVVVDNKRNDIIWRRDNKLFTTSISNNNNNNTISNSVYSIINSNSNINIKNKGRSYVNKYNCDFYNKQLRLFDMHLTTTTNYNLRKSNQIFHTIHS